MSLESFKKFIISNEGKDCFRKIMRKFRVMRKIQKTERDESSSSYVPLTFEAMLHHIYEQSCRKNL